MNERTNKKEEKTNRKIHRAATQLCENPIQWKPRMFSLFVRRRKAKKKNEITRQPPLNRIHSIFHAHRFVNV